MPILFAVMSLCCAAANDVVYKRRSTRADESYRHLVIVSLVWAVVFIGPALPLSGWTAAALRWGILSGLAGVCAHLLLLAAMRGCEATTCSTIYRLNLVPATLIAVVAFGEHLTVAKAVAISAAVGALGLFASGGRKVSRRHLALALGACVLRAVMALAYKQGLDQGSGAMPLLAVNGLCWSAGSLLWLLAMTRLEWRHWDRPHVSWGLLSGMLVSGNVLFLTLALARAPISTVLPISQLSFVLTAVLGFLLYREPLGIARLAGSGLAVCSVIVLSCA